LIFQSKFWVADMPNLGILVIRGCTMPTPETVFQTDARRRTTMPKVIPPNETFTIEPLDDGTFRLIPMTMIPSHQLWAWRPEVQEAVEKALQEPGVSLDSPEGKAFMRKLAK
jgi:hypothetical protein